MKRDDELRLAVHGALDDCLSGVDALPSRKNAIERSLKGEDKVRRKLSFGLVVAMAVVLVAVGALAATLLSARELVETELVPLAQQNDSEDFTSEELAYILDLAKENGIELPEALVQKLQEGHGYYEEETIMELARVTFGGLYYTWNIEEQYWYDEMMVAIGYIDENYHCLPTGDDLTEPEAKAKAAAAILAATGDDVTAEGRWRMFDSYGCCGTDDAGDRLPPQWTFDFERTALPDRSYYVTLARDGQVDSLTWEDGLTETSTAEAVLGLYEFVYGQESGWPMETWIALHDEMAGRDFSAKLCWAYANTTFLLPESASVTRSQAEEAALQAVSSEGTIDHAVLCQGDDGPVWVVEVMTQPGGGEGNRRTLAEVDGETGIVTQQRRYDAVTSTSGAERYIPASVLDSLPPLPVTVEYRVLTYQTALRNALAGKQAAALGEHSNADAAYRQTLLALDFTQETAQARIDEWVARYGDDMDFWPVEISALMYMWANCDEPFAARMIPEEGDIPQAQAEMTARSAFRAALGQEIPAAYRMAVCLCTGYADDRCWLVRFVDTSRTTGREAGEVLVNAKTGQVVNCSAEPGGNG